MKKIVTIGEILVEVMATERGEGFREPLSLIGPFPSGAPAIFIDQAARFEQPCGMIGCVGDDDFGRLNVDRLAGDGVDVSAIAIDPERPTGSAFVRYRPDGARDFVFNIKHSASGCIRLNDKARALLAGSDHLHVMGTALFSPAIVETILEALAIIKDKGGSVSFDPNLRREMLSLPGLQEALETIFSRCDLFLPSGEELFLFSAASDEALVVAGALDSGVKAIVVKQGARGAAYHDRAGRLHQPAFAVEEVDPTGAGDCFGAVFVSCWLRGMPPAAALRYAAAAGAHAVTRQGPLEGAASRAELDAFLEARVVA